MTTLPFMKWYPKDFLMDTQILSNEAIGCYVKLLNIMWITSPNGVLTVNLTRLCNLFNTEEDKTMAILDEINGVIDIKNAGTGDYLITSRRIQKDKNDLTNQAERQKRFYAKQGKKTNAIPNGEPNANLTPKKAEGRRQIKKPPISPGEFDLFWNVYPNKVAKQKAIQSWAKIKPDLEVVLLALKWQTESDQWKKDGGQFIPYPSTWLNQRRFEDEMNDPYQNEKKRREALDARADELIRGGSSPRI